MYGTRVKKAGGEGFSVAFASVENTYRSIVLGIQRIFNSFSFGTFGRWLNLDFGPLALCYFWAVGVRGFFLDHMSLNTPINFGCWGLKSPGRLVG